MDGLIALLRISSRAYLHQALPLELTIRNLHLSRSANPVISLEQDASDSFVVAGPRSGRLPVLLPGTEQKITWQLIPIECGPAVRLPKIRLTNRRPADSNEKGHMGPSLESETEGEEVRIVDVRWDGKNSEGTKGAPPSRSDIDASSLRPRGVVDGEYGRQENLGTVLVLPHNMV